MKKTKISADNVQAVMDAGSRNTCMEDFYDEDILTDKECPKCGNFLWSHPDCTNTCSDDNCDYNSIK